MSPFQQPLRVFLQNDAPADAIMYRLPQESFPTRSVLLVQPGEQAVFVRNGAIVYEFRREGRYVLETSNFAFLDRLWAPLTGGQGTYSCQIYFVRTVTSPQLHWGGNLQVRDPCWGIATELGVNGAYRIHIESGAKFLTALFGSNARQITAAELERSYFSAELLRVVKSAIAQEIQDAGEEIVGIEARLDALSRAIQPKLGAALAEHGVAVDDFSISQMTIMDRKTRELLETAFAQKQAIAALGGNWERAQILQALTEMASAPGGPTGVAGGVGAGLAAAELLHRLTGGLGSALAAKRCPTCAAPVAEGDAFCRRCGARLEAEVTASGFCPQCGTAVAADDRFCRRCGAKLDT